MTGTEPNLRFRPLDWLLVALVAATSVPTATLAGGDLVDGSWILGLSWAHDQGLAWGRDLAFTYGPLGFVRQAVPFSPWLVAVAVVFGLLTFVALAAAVRLVTACVGTLWSWVITALACGVAGLLPEQTAPLVAVFLWCWLLVAATPFTPRGTSVAYALLGAAAGVLTLVKFNLGTTTVALVLVAAVAGRWRRDVPLGAGGALLGWLIAWLLAGQPVGSAYAWLTDSIEIARGYAYAMGNFTDDPWAWPALVAAALTAAALAVGGHRWGRRFPWRPRVVLALLLVLLLVSAGLQAFVRFDPGHVALFFLITAPVALAVVAGAPWPDSAPAWAGPLPATGVTALVSVIPLLALVGSAGGTQPPWQVARWPSPWHPVTSVRDLAGESVLVANETARQERLASLRASFMAQAAVPPEVAAAVAGRPGHAEPQAVAALWAVGGRWRPVPVFQTYQAYTASLDRLNADALVGPDAPEVVLRQNVAPEGRNPLWEAPEQQVQLLCRYRQDVAGGGWQALSRGEDRCGAAIALGRAELRAGDPVPVPTAPDALVTATVESADGRGRTTLRCDGLSYELPQPVPVGPLVLSVPDSLGWVPTMLPPTCVSVAVDRPATIRWEAVPVG